MFNRSKIIKKTDVCWILKSNFYRSKSLNSKKTLPRLFSTSNRATLISRPISSSSTLALLRLLNSPRLVELRASTSSLELHSDPSLLTTKLASRSLNTWKLSSNGQLSSLPTEPSSQQEVSFYFIKSWKRAQSLPFKFLILILAIHHASQKRPRSRTLKAVHNALLNDIVQPSSITGRQTRVSINGKRTETIYLDPLDQASIKDRLGAMAHAYAKLTTHSV